MVSGGRTSKHKMILIFLSILCCVLLIRLFVLTVVQHDKWKGYGEAASLRAVYETAPRGDILDRNGKKLATSKAVYSVNLSRVNLPVETALASAAGSFEILKQNGEDVETTQQEIAETLQASGYQSYLPITISGQVSRQSARQIADQKLPGIQIAVSYIREYPYGSLASHVLGYLGQISEEERKTYTEAEGYRQDARIGKSGIERAFEKQLHGKDAVSRFQVDASGNVTRLVTKSKAKKGKNVKLTLDADLQKATEESLQQGIEQAAAGGTFASKYGDYSMTYAKNAASGAAVVLDVKTGQVLAMASAPDFDPNDFAVKISREKWNSLQRKNLRDPMSPAPLYNVATMSAVQPGSTFKPVTALAALSCGLDPARYLYDAGYVELGGKTYGCHIWNKAKTTHGYVDLKKALAVSCNYYFYDIASGQDLASGKSLGYRSKIDNDRILSYAQDMGLGEKTGIEIPESKGILPTEQRKKRQIKSSLKQYLLEERETWFRQEFCQDSDKVDKLVEKIINWADKDGNYRQTKTGECHRRKADRSSGEYLQVRLLRSDPLDPGRYFQYCHRAGGSCVYDTSNGTVHGNPGKRGYQKQRFADCKGFYYRGPAVFQGSEDRRTHSVSYKSHDRCDRRRGRVFAKTVCVISLYRCRKDGNGTADGLYQYGGGILLFEALPASDRA